MAKSWDYQGGYVDESKYSCWGWNFTLLNFYFILDFHTACIVWNLSYMLNIICNWYPMACIANCYKFGFGQCLLTYEGFFTYLLPTQRQDHPLCHTQQKTSSQHRIPCLWPSVQEASLLHLRGWANPVPIENIGPESLFNISFSFYTLRHWIYKPALRMLMHTHTSKGCQLLHFIQKS